MAKVGRKPFRSTLSKIIADLGELQQQAEKLPVSSAEPSEPITAAIRNIEAVVQDWNDSAAAQICRSNEQLADYYEGVLRSILVLLLSCINQALQHVETRVNLHGGQMGINELLGTVSGLGGLLVKMRDVSGRKKPAPTPADIDAAIRERRIQLGEPVES